MDTSLFLSDFTAYWAFLLSAMALFSPQWALIGGAYLLGAWGISTQPKRSEQWLNQMALVWCGGGLLALLIIANLRIGLLSARTLVFLTPYLAVIAGYGLSTLAKSSRHILSAVLVISLIGAPGLLQPRLDYPAAAQAVALDYMPGDLVVLENGWDDNAFRYELILALGEGAAPDIVRTLPWVDNRDLNQPVLPQVEPLLETHRRVWLVNWLQPSQVSAFLDGGGDGFIRVLKRQTATGSQYQTLFSDQTVREILFERPQADAANPIAQFGDGLFLRDGLLPITARVGQRVQLDLWWSATTPAPHDYSASVFIMDNTGAVRAQSDQPPGGATSQWSSNDLKFDRHTVTLPTDLAPGTYQIGVDMYWYGDGQRLPISKLRSGLTTDKGYVIIGQVQVTR
jgi:hypothetical protein